MKNQTNYGKIIAVTLSVITCACTIAFVLYRLFRNLIKFCNTYQLDEDDDLDLDLSELDEALFDDDDEPAEEIVVETPEVLATEEAVEAQ